MTTPMVLVATWRDGLFLLARKTLDQELHNSRSKPSHPTGVAAPTRLSLAAHCTGVLRAACGARSLPRSWTSRAAWQLATSSTSGPTMPAFCASARMEHSSNSAASTRATGVRHVCGLGSHQRSARGTAARDPLDHCNPGRPGPPATSTSAVSLGRPTAAQRGSRPSTSRATSTRFARTRTVQTS